MKIYKVNWTIKYYHQTGNIVAQENTLRSAHKYTLDKNKATDIVKELEKCAAYLGLTKELRTSIEEMEAE